eukprot:CAMPEP_0206470970 /NCGR_PEP_ID=MMETSP0324_2-20121206/31268_1 /ASSEMBLY_ACC=CAM_ASM_000836 /TAXON_ID=2866 /ORGANISM="Crypthecodinium cohnii, Strain Seligo" /LENGTH=617 /DNA_ID=CAMNT_0053945173 /DNA_START=33 /DNA_END=1886 /DNA_ORIENTATION=-
MTIREDAEMKVENPPNGSGEDGNVPRKKSKKKKSKGKKNTTNTNLTNQLPPAGHIFVPEVSSPDDYKYSEVLLKGLEEEFPQENPQDTELRQGVLEELERVMTEWMTKVGMEEHNLPESEARGSANKLLLLGSFKLGAAYLGSDTDILCIGPPHISREAFFSSFVEKLKQLSDVDCLAIPDAFTPIIKIRMRGVNIDLLFAVLPRILDTSVSLEDALMDDEVLRDMDEKSVRSVNGYRAAVKILQKVPNHDTFRASLRFVKHWAIRRGIYSNVLGFFGGITWSLMVAKICQMHPDLAPNWILVRFFQHYSQWDWSVPVVLGEIQPERPNEKGFSHLKVWNPKTNAGDKHHAMPVITPTFPAMNTTHNVSSTTQKLLVSELVRAYRRCCHGTCSTLFEIDWWQIAEPLRFFSRWPEVVSIEVLAKNEEVFQKVIGWVESKLRLLVRELESTPCAKIRPNPRQYRIKGSMDTPWRRGCGLFVGVGYMQVAMKHSSDLRGAFNNFINIINSWSEGAMYEGDYIVKLGRRLRSTLPNYTMEAEEVEYKQAGKRRQFMLYSADIPHPQLPPTPSSKPAQDEDDTFMTPANSGDFLSTIEEKLDKGFWDKKGGVKDTIKQEAN